MNYYFEKSIQTRIRHFDSENQNIYHNNFIPFNEKHLGKSENQHIRITIKVKNIYKLFEFNRAFSNILVLANYQKLYQNIMKRQL